MNGRASSPTGEARAKAPKKALPVVSIVLLALLGTAGVVAGMGAAAPRDWHVIESMPINASPTVVHEVLSDLSNWPEWALWDRSVLEPDSQLGPITRGVGASLAWQARDAEGAVVTGGRVTIVSSDPSVGVSFESRRENDAPSTAAFRYRPGPGVTEVSWEDRGQLPPILGGLFRDLYQKRLRSHLRRSLERIEQLVEAKRASHTLAE